MRKREDSLTAYGLTRVVNKYFGYNQCDKEQYTNIIYNIAA